MAREGLPGLTDCPIDAKKQLDDTLKTSCGLYRRSATHSLIGPLETFLAKVTAFVGEIVPIINMNDDVGSISMSGIDSSGRGEGQQQSAEGNKSSSSTSREGEEGIVVRGDTVSGPVGHAGTQQSSTSSHSHSRSRSQHSRTGGGGEAAWLSLKTQSFMRPERVRELLTSVTQSVTETCPDLRHTLQVRDDLPACRYITSQCVRFIIIIVCDCSIVYCVDLLTLLVL